MNNEVLEINYEIYLDLLEKGNVDKDYIRTYKLVHILIYKNYITESYVLMRMLYEEILYDLAIISDNNFKITVKTEVGEIRKQVINNISILFDGFIDEEYIKSLYNYLSKMTHENTIKKVLKDMLNNSRIKDFTNTNTIYMLLIIGHFYLSNIYKNQEIKKLIDYLLIISTIEFTKNQLKLDKSEIEKYSNYFVDIKDKNYVEKTKNEFNEIIKDLNKENSNDNYVEIQKEIYNLLKKYNYYKFYTKFIKKNNKKYK